MEIWNNTGPIIPMVPNLHLGNAYIKRKLRVWRAYKSNHLVGAIHIQADTGFPTTRLETRTYRNDNGNFGQFGARYPHGTVFALRQCLHQKEATGMDSVKM